MSAGRPYGAAAVRTDEGSHRCPVRVCKRDVPTERLMCPGHWRMAPKPLQRAVWAAWRDGEGAGTVAHLAACQAAVRAVELQLEAAP